MPRTSKRAALLRHCDAFPDWRRFEATQSSTYSVASDDADLNHFDVQYEDGESVRILYIYILY